MLEAWFQQYLFNATELEFNHKHKHLLQFCQHDEWTNRKNIDISKGKKVFVLFLLFFLKIPDLVPAVKIFYSQKKKMV